MNDNRFTIFIGTKHVVSIFSCQKSISVLLHARMKQYLIYLQTFQCDMHYKKSTEHGNVDALPNLPFRNEDLSQQFNSYDVINESEIIQVNLFSILPLNPKSVALAAKYHPLLRQIFHQFISVSEIQKNLLFKICFLCFLATPLHIFC